MNTSRKRLGRPSFRGLLATRHGAFVLALLCALIAVGILLFALSQYRHTITGSAKQSTVLVSTAEIQKGTSADALAAQRLYKVVPVLAGQIAPGAVVDAGALVGKVAANTILPGEQLTVADFTAPSGLSAVLTPTERAIGVTLDPAHAVADVLQAGDHVDVYGMFNSSVSLIVADAVVLKPPSGTGGGSTALLEMSDQLTPKVMWTFDNGKVWLELRGSNAADPSATTTGAGQVTLGDQPSTATAYQSAASTGGHR